MPTHSIPSSKRSGCSSADLRVKAYPTRFRGVYAALVTPTTRDECVDERRLTTFADHLIRQGVHGLIPLGSTGEYYALTPASRRRVVEITLEVARNRVPVLVGANAGATRDVITFSREAEHLGADGVLLAPPYYSLPTPEELFAHFRAVNDAIGIPIMLYNYPGRTGVDMSPEFIERLAALPNVRYVKESTGEMPRITALLRRCGEQVGVFCGCDTIALESLLVGAIGWVGGVVNVLPRSHVRLFELVADRQDLPAARQLYFALLPTLQLMEGAGKYTQFVKAACALLGQPVGAPLRPLQRASRKECAALRATLKLTPEGQER